MIVNVIKKYVVKIYMSDDIYAILDVIELYYMHDTVKMVLRVYENPSLFTKKNINKIFANASADLYVIRTELNILENYIYDNYNIDA